MVRKYSESHEWVEIEGMRCKVGISDYAQKKLGSIVYVELPKQARKVKAGETVSVLESTKAAADVYSPLSGTIVAVNELLTNAPELINHSPEEQGWLYEIEIEDAAEIEELMDIDSYKLIVE
jgi:glycine cleavage system H protein